VSQTPHIDLSRIIEIKNDPHLTEDQKQKLAYREIWGMSFAQDLGVRLVFVGVLIILLIEALG
jgi:hypothetical protein